jgi:hypothetical protein
LAALGGCLYAIGGMDSPKAGHWGLPLKTVERYDPVQDHWFEVASMNEARFGCAVAAHQVNHFLPPNNFTLKIVTNSNYLIEKIFRLFLSINYFLLSLYCLQQ